MYVKPEDQDVALSSLDIVIIVSFVLCGAVIHSQESDSRNCWGKQTT